MMSQNGKIDEELAGFSAQTKIGKGEYRGCGRGTGVL
jgi:hypothetical protein